MHHVAHVAVSCSERGTVCPLVRISLLITSSYARLRTRRCPLHATRHCVYVCMHACVCVCVCVCVWNRVFSSVCAFTFHCLYTHHLARIIALDSGSGRLTSCIRIINTHTHIHFQRLAEGGVSALCAALRVNVSLTSLNLRGCSLGR
jgi:hypothetical protein